jgi:hypothetical protein
VRSRERERGSENEPSGKQTSSHPNTPKSTSLMWPSGVTSTLSSFKSLQREKITNRMSSTRIDCQERRYYETCRREACTDKAAECVLTHSPVDKAILVQEPQRLADLGRHEYHHLLLEEPLSLHRERDRERERETERGRQREKHQMIAKKASSSI